MRRSRRPDENILLPWPIEIVFAVAGLVCVPFAMWWFLGEITAPAIQFGKALGVAVDVQPVIIALEPMIWIIGVIVGFRVWFFLRKWFIGKVNSVL